MYYANNHHNWNRTSTTARTASPATDKQQALIAKLEGERAVSCVWAGGTKDAASKYITQLMAMPRTAIAATATTAAEPAPAPATEVGMYRKGSDIYRVKISGAGRAYAMKLTEINGERLRDADGYVANWTFVYERGAIAELTAADKLTLDEARAFGIRTGTCCVCARTLTDAKSVAAGIGPVCAKHF